MKKYSEAWQPYQLRFSLIGPEEGISKPDLAELFGIEVQDTTVSGPNKDLIQTGVYGAGLLSMRVTTSRFDFIWESLPPINGLLRLGAIADAAPFILDPIRNLIGAHTWARVAFGSLAGAEVPDRAAGYRQLDERIDEVSIDVDGSTDFLYQINKSVIVAAPSGDVALNLYRKWAVAKVKFKGIVQMEGVEGDVELPQLRVAQVVLDFNTPATEGRRLTGEDCLAVLQHAVLEAAELIGE